MKKILVAEDQESISRLIKTYLVKEGYEVDIANDGFEALDCFNNYVYDLICLDVMMPNVNGWDVTETIRKTSSVPIILTTALSDDENILKGYELGIDDYVTKPFNPRILIAKINRIINKNEKIVDDYPLLTYSNLKLHTKERIVHLDNEELRISKTEFDLLQHLLLNKQKVCSRENLIENVWGMEVYVDDRIVDTYIKRLRKTLKDNGYIKTIYGIGYKIG